MHDMTAELQPLESEIKASLVEHDRSINAQQVRRLLLLLDVVESLDVLSKEIVDSVAERDGKLARLAATLHKNHLELAEAAKEAKRCVPALKNRGWS